MKKRLFKLAETCLLVQDWVAKLGEPTLQMLFRTYSVRVPRQGPGSRKCKPLGQTRHDGPLLSLAFLIILQQHHHVQRRGLADATVWGCEDLQIAGTHSHTPHTTMVHRSGISTLRVGTGQGDPGRGSWGYPSLASTGACEK